MINIPINRNIVFHHFGDFVSSFKPTGYFFSFLLLYLQGHVNPISDFFGHYDFVWKRKFAIFIFKPINLSGDPPAPLSTQPWESRRESGPKETRHYKAKPWNSFLRDSRYLFDFEHALIIKITKKDILAYTQYNFPFLFKEAHCLEFSLKIIIKKKKRLNFDLVYLEQGLHPPPPFIHDEAEYSFG